MGSEKRVMEIELEQVTKWLIEESGAGLTGTLIDEDGFPKGNLDCYAIRVARNRRICLENDLKDLMKRLEAKLHALHAFYLQQPNQPDQEIKKVFKQEKP